MDLEVNTAWARSLTKEQKEALCFVCPVSGAMKVKLYASTKQFPAILYQVLQEIESEGYAVREMYVDTFIVNISKQTEDVAAMFKMRIVPVSAGTPEEMAFAERAVQTLAQMSRALMVGAPHLPQWCWGLSDLQAANIHRILPQKRKNDLSPYEITTQSAPNLEAMYMRVFGCACQYAPMEGAQHKRASKTKWGWYVGIQWPMVLVLRPEDNKVISVSRKKIHCHELCHAKFDPTTQPRPVICFTDFALREEEVDDAIKQAIKQSKEKIKEVQKQQQVPKHVPSVKSLSDYRRNSDLNMAIPNTLPSHEILDSLPHADHQGEDQIGATQLANDDLMEKINKWTKSREDGTIDSAATLEIIKALEASQGSSSHVPRRGELKRGAKKSAAGYDEATEIDRGKILQRKQQARLPEIKGKDVRELTTKARNVIRVGTGKLKVGDQVKTATERFGEQYAEGKPKYTFGKVKKRSKAS
jgi:hypothetical protein